MLEAEKRRLESIASEEVPAKYGVPKMRNKPEPPQRPERKVHGKLPKKPTPRSFHNADRKRELIQAIQEHTYAESKIDIEWIIEYNQLV